MLMSIFSNATSLQFYAFFDLRITFARQDTRNYAVSDAVERDSKHSLTAVHWRG